jgi:hypothetical protein
VVAVSFLIFLIRKKQGSILLTCLGRKAERKTSLLAKNRN